jgi:hypothetical protein
VKGRTSVVELLIRSDECRTCKRGCFVGRSNRSGYVSRGPRECKIDVGYFCCVIRLYWLPVRMEGR